MITVNANHNPTWANLETTVLEQWNIWLCPHLLWGIQMGSRRWAEWADSGGGGEGRGSWRVKADRGGLREPGFQINLPDCVVNVHAAHNSCRWLPSVTIQLCDKYFPSYLAASSAFWLMDLWCAYSNHFFRGPTSLCHKCVVMFFFSKRLFSQCWNWASGLFCPFPPPSTPPQASWSCSTPDLGISLCKRINTCLSDKRCKCKCSLHWGFVG